jgi:DNA-binding PucR family transcriptional regulator
VSTVGVPSARSEVSGADRGTLEPSRRDQLSRLNALLVLSMLMTGSSDEQQVLRLGVSAAPSFVDCVVLGVRLDDDGWVPWPTNDRDDVRLGHGLPDDLPSDGGPVTVPGHTWAWAFPLGGLGAAVGAMVVGAEQPPDHDASFVLRALAQQTGVAISNARLHRNEREASAQLAAVNARLEQTVQTLERTMATHERLTRAAVSGEGQEGIARAVHEVTGLPVAIEDRFGNLRAWAGPGCPSPYPKDASASRDQLLRRLLRADRPVRQGGRLLAIASPRPDVVGVIALVDPVGHAGPAELAALEHGATVLAMELARLRSVAEAELRVRRDLIEDLLAGMDEQTARSRGDGLDVDLSRSHRVVVFSGRGRSGDDEQFFHAVRRAVRDHGLGALLMSRAGTVVLLTDREVSWSDLHAGVLRELDGGHCRIGVGSRTDGPADFPRSHREAQTALNLQASSGAREQATLFEGLGVYRILASARDQREVDQFVRQWLGALMDYDESRHADLVETLAQYLECGGNYDATSKALCVHRSTLKYRLQRIREISGFALGEPDVNFNLQLACRAWRTLRAVQG